MQHESLNLDLQGSVKIVTTEERCEMKHSERASGRVFS